jgi:hypothetical protein
VSNKLGGIEPIRGLGASGRLFGELSVAVHIQRLIAARRAGGPIGEFRLRHDPHVEQHVRKIVAAEMRGNA